MADFAGETVCSRVNPAAANDPPTDAGADRHIDQIVIAATGAKALLGKRRQVGVVTDGGGEVKSIFEVLSEWHFVPARKVGERQSHAAAQIDHSGRCDANTAYRPSRPGHDLANCCPRCGAARRPCPAAPGGNARASQDRAGAVNQRHARVSYRPMSMATARPDIWTPSCCRLQWWREVQSRCAISRPYWRRMRCRTGSQELVQGGICVAEPCDIVVNVQRRTERPAIQIGDDDACLAGNELSADVVGMGRQTRRVAREVVRLHQSGADIAIEAVMAGHDSVQLAAARDVLVVEHRTLPGGCTPSTSRMSASSILATMGLRPGKNWSGLANPCARSGGTARGKRQGLNLTCQEVVSLAMCTRRTCGPERIG